MVQCATKECITQRGCGAELCLIWMICFKLLFVIFVVVLWSCKICGVRANLGRRNKFTRTEKPSEVFWCGWRYKGASKKWELSERAMRRLCG